MLCGPFCSLWERCPTSQLVHLSVSAAADSLPPCTLRALPQVGLLIIDEIHLLGADRGPILEVIVSRMRYIAAQVRNSAVPWGVRGPQGRLGIQRDAVQTMHRCECLASCSADGAQHPVCGPVHRAGQRPGSGRLAGYHRAGALQLQAQRAPSAARVPHPGTARCCCWWWGGGGGRGGRQLVPERCVLPASPRAAAYNPWPSSTPSIALPPPPSYAPPHAHRATRASSIAPAWPP